jgi:16S rRNA (guanine527-N7)-methyltransferase
VKHLHEQYVELVRAGPSGLFSRSDLERLEAHAEDGCTGASLLAERGVASLVDVGSGGGVPGLQLAIELGGCSVHLVESQGWKAEFLLACARALDLESRVTVHASRVEEVVDAVGGRERLDAGTARAVAAPIVVAEYLSPLVRPGGLLLLWTTSHLAASAGVGARPELGLGEPVLHPAPSSLRDNAVLLEWPKVSPCDERYPRRTGVAAKRPLT